MSAHCPGVSRAEGNTRPPPRIAASKRWCFTWNNYPCDWNDQLSNIFTREDKWIGTPEVGDSGTPHIQGYVEFAKGSRPMGYRGMPKEIHWEKAKGTKQQNIAYCTKTDGESHGTIKKPRVLTFPEMTRPYQIDVLNILQDEPDNRTIHWFYGDGNIGKTTFCKFLIVNHGACLLQGKGNDVRNAVLTWYKDKDEFPEICVFDVPRCYEKEYVSYEALENIKNMSFYSGKYEGGQVVGPCPHLFVFANMRPCMEKMSADRWRVYKIDSDYEAVLRMETYDSDGYSSGGHLYPDASN